MSVIDSLEFARTGQTVRGSLPIRELARLKDSLADTLGTVEFELKGGCDARGRPVLTLGVRGMLHLQCQRCMRTLDYPLQVLNTLLLVTAGEVAASKLDEEEAEWIEASRELEIAAVVEDEIILGLPYAPRHEQGTCSYAGNAVKDGAANSAFGRLALLKQRSH